MPWLAALVCCSAFDIALHDAYGQCLGLPVYETYGPAYMNADLSAYLQPAAGYESFLLRSVSQTFFGLTSDLNSYCMASGWRTGPVDGSGPDRQ